MCVVGEYLRKWQESFTFPLPGDDRPIPTRRKDSYTMEFEMPSDPIGAAVMGGYWTGEHEEDVRFAQDLLARFTYKPGWHFEIRRGTGHPVLHVAASVIDSRAVNLMGSAHVRECPTCREFTGVRIPVEGQFPLPVRLRELRDPEGEFFRFLRNTIWFVERHEADEWFRVDGELRYDPHANDWVAKR